MLTFVRGDLFESPAQVLVNTVNTVGVMGKGIALTFKQVYPEMFSRYVALCEAKTLDIGKLWLFKTDQKWVLNFPTKRHWRQSSKLEYIDAGLKRFVDTYSSQGIASIAFPELGCGNGELNWTDVGPLMARYLKALPINIYIYLYDRSASAPAEHRDIAAMRQWLRSEPRSLAFAEFWEDLRETVGSGLALKLHRNHEDFTVEVVTYDREGLLLHVGDRTWMQYVRDYARNTLNHVFQGWRFASEREVYISDECLLELWQSIRFHGFCFPKMMPGGLDRLAEYLMPLLARLSYMKPIRLATAIDAPDQLDDALRLHIAETATIAREEPLSVVSA
jgi:O-acetyl-ADP-ribose deacetylase (regulator of RNase III)